MTEKLLTVTPHRNRNMGKIMVDPSRFSKTDISFLDPLIFVYLAYYWNHKYENQLVYGSLIGDEFVTDEETLNQFYKDNPNLLSLADNNFIKKYFESPEKAFNVCLDATLTNMVDDLEQSSNDVADTDVSPTTSPVTSPVTSPATSGVTSPATSPATSGVTSGVTSGATPSKPVDKDLDDPAVSRIVSNLKKSKNR